MVQNDGGEKRPPGLTAVWLLAAAGYIGMSLCLDLRAGRPLTLPRLLLLAALAAGFAAIVVVGVALHRRLGYTKSAFPQIESGEGGRSGNLRARLERRIDAYVDSLPRPGPDTERRNLVVTAIATLLCAGFGIFRYVTHQDYSLPAFWAAFGALILAIAFGMAHMKRRAVDKQDGNRQ